MLHASIINTLFSTSLFVLVPSLFLVYYILWIVYARTFHPLASIPGPFLASISRLWIVQRVLQGDMEHTQRALHARYGPLIRIAPNEIACASPDAIKKVYPVQNPLEKTDFYPVWGNKKFSKYPDNFSNASEKLHSERRRIVNSIYSLSNVLQSEKYIDVCSGLFVERMGEFADSGQVCDFGEWLQMYAFDVIGELYFGRMFGFMQNRHDHGNYIEALDTLMPVVCGSAVAASYARPFMMALSLLVPGLRKSIKALDHIDVAARSCVATRFEGQYSATGKTDSAPRRDLLQQLLEIRETKGEKVDFTLGDVESEAYVGLFAGSDTTAIAMRSIFYHLMKHPSVYAELMSELDAAANNGQLSFPVKYAEAIKLPLLCACIKEGMRLHPSVGLTMPRISPAGGLQLCDKYIPAGYNVGLNPAVIHFDKSVFGPDADVYRPNRWLEGDTAAMDRCMLQFGAGTRTCIGKNISLSEMHKLIPQVLRTFTLQMADEGAEWKTSDIWFNKQTGIDVRLTRRNLV